MPDPTRVEGADDSARRDEPTTADAPARWSGAAPVPQGQSKKPWWSWRRTVPEDEDDWATTPPVDPWADQDTPWSLEPLPAPGPMPPTRIDAPSTPPTRIDAPAPPPTRIDAPSAPPPVPTPAPAPTRPAPTPAQAAAAAQAQAPARNWWGRRRQAPPPAAPVNRLAVQPRPVTPPPPPYRPPAFTPPPAARPPAARPSAARPPAGPPPPPRRRRRWPRRLFLFTLLSAACCCGIPAYFAWPAAQQYPVSAILPGEVADLSLRDDASSKRAAERLSEQLRDSNLAGQEVFAGVYSDGNGKRVTIFGTTGLRLTPKQDVEAELSHLASDYGITDVESYDLGETGAHERCGVGRSGGSAVVVCAWADHGSLATVLLTRRNVSESAELVGVLRTAVLTRD